MPSRSSLALRIGAALGAALLLAAAVGCASKPDVRHDQDPSADFAAYRSFAFDGPLPSDRTQYTTLLAARMQASARQQMEQRRYVYNEDRPDLRISMSLVVTEHQDLRSTATGGPGWRGWNSTGFDTVDYRLGTLVVDLIDTRRNALVWHGVAEGRLDARALEQPGTAIDAAVAEVFARLPVTATASR